MSWDGSSHHFRSKPRWDSQHFARVHTAVVFLTHMCARRNVSRQHPSLWRPECPELLVGGQDRTTCGQIPGCCFWFFCELRVHYIWLSLGVGHTKSSSKWTWTQQLFLQKIRESHVPHVIFMWQRAKHQQKLSTLILTKMRHFSVQIYFLKILMNLF